MNIFYLDKDPTACARFHCDSHVVKQILESAQLLSTAHRVYAQGYLSKEMDENIYKITHQHHPSYKWVACSRGNYEYLFELLKALLMEYTYRYNNKHATERLIEYLKEPPLCIPDLGFTKFTQVVPEDCLNEDAVQAYRDYYSKHKLRLLDYTKRNIPEWVYIVRTGWKV